MSSFTSSSDNTRFDETKNVRLATPIRLTAFLLLVGAVLVCLGEILETVRLSWDPYCHKVSQIMALRQQRNDVVYLGDSTTLDSVNPAIIDRRLGIKSFNLATGGQSVLESEVVLRHYLAHNEKPQLVVLGLFVNRSRDVVANERMHPYVYTLLNGDLQDLYRRRVREATGASVSWGDRLASHVKAYVHRTAIDSGIKYGLFGSAIMPEVIQGHFAFSFTRPITLGAEHEIRVEWHGLNALLKYCEEQELRVLVFEPPNNPGFSRRSIGRTESLARLRTLTNARPNIHFVSFNDENSLVYTDDEWRGLCHLNEKGAIRFSREQLAPVVAKNRR